MNKKLGCKKMNQNNQNKPIGIAISTNLLKSSDLIAYSIYNR
jgi:hypothetical protein